MPGPAGQHTHILQQDRARKKVTGRLEVGGRDFWASLAKIDQVVKAKFVTAFTSGTRLVRLRHRFEDRAATVIALFPAVAFAFGISARTTATANQAVPPE
jgi:hypothetical protein